MKKLRLIGVHSQKEELLRELMLLGCVEVSDPAGRPDREELAAFRRPDGGKVWQKRSEQTTIVNALRLLDKHAPAKKGLLTPNAPSCSTRALWPPISLWRERSSRWMRRRAAFSPAQAGNAPRRRP